MMAGMAAKSLALDAAAPDGGGLAFYAFDDIADTRAFIDRWYAALNALDLGADARARVVDEANAVFALNIEVFDELEGNAARAVWAFAAESVIAVLREQATGWPAGARRAP